MWGGYHYWCCRLFTARNAIAENVVAGNAIAAVDEASEKEAGWYLSSCKAVVVTIESTERLATVDGVPAVFDWVPTELKGSATAVVAVNATMVGS